MAANPRTYQSLYRGKASRLDPSHARAFALRGNDLLDAPRDIGWEAALGHLPRVRPDGCVRDRSVDRSGVRLAAQICPAD